LLFIVPGIILSLGWSQTYYIMHDDPDISAIDALKKSWAMMEGFKADYFVLALIYFLLIIASVFTLFIGLLWVMPFMSTIYAKYYDQIKHVNFPEDAEDGDDYASHLLDF